VSAASVGLTVSHSSTPPRSSRRWRWTISAPAEVNPARACSGLNTSSTNCRTSRTERRETTSGWSTKPWRAAVDIELRRIGSLEGEDRLFLVADGEDRAHDRLPAAARPLNGIACKKFCRQRFDDSPLLRAGVLRLVDQQVIDASIELVEHPGRRLALLEQLPRLHDQVVVVESAACFLEADIFAPHRVGDNQRRLRECRGMRRAP